MFCPECGADHHIADRAEEAAADREVTLAKITADRDIKIAQINASVTRDVAETENALDTAHAEGVAEGMETALGSAAVDGQADELGEPGDPVVLEVAPPEPEPEPEPDLAPPELAGTSSPSSSSRSSGWWSGYR